MVDFYKLLQRHRAMNYPPPPPPPPAAQENAVTDWGVSRGHYPPPPPPAPVQATPVDTKQRINIRNKGQRGEREVVKLLQVVVDRIRQSKGLQPLVIKRDTTACDSGGEDLTGLPGFAIEVKFQENENLTGWWKQAVAQAAARGPETVPVLFYRASRQKFKVRFRCYVATPKDRDQVEMDVDTSVDDFIEWFGNAYDEALG